MEDGEEVVFFYSRIRDNAVTLFSLAFLCFLSYSINKYYLSPATFMSLWRPKNVEQSVSRIIIIICTLLLSVALAGQVLFLSSVVGNEIHLAFPTSSYTGWINRAFFTGLWNNFFLSSNVCLVFLLPFAYFLMEAEGFAGTRKGLLSRMYESFVIAVLTVIMIGLIVWLGLSLWQQHLEYSMAWTLHHNVYSVIALFGVLLSTLCAPFGVCRAFDLFNAVLTQTPSSLSLKQHLEIKRTSLKRELKRVKNGETKIKREIDSIQEQLQDIVTDGSRGLLYPLLFCLLLGFTIVSFIMVGLNILSLLFLGKDIVVYIEGWKGPVISLVVAVIQFLVGLSFGPCVLIGFYTSPFLNTLLPRKHQTSLFLLLVNCGVCLTLVSALPLLLSTLGLVRFKVFGNFLTFPWLDSLSLKLAYNFIFEGLTLLILTQKVSLSIIGRIPYVMASRLPLPLVHSRKRTNRKF